MRRAIPIDAAATQPASTESATIDRLLSGEASGAPATGARPDLEETLRLERSLLRTIIESLPAHIYAKDRDSRFIACNERVAQCM
ncbi:MAG TPA: hypothetical protein VN691_11170, partial [Steroidobacteraceae bacterium]|nr:hypothetical protein [Steroidobacteraceae bacterium]